MQYEEQLQRLNADIQADARALRISNQVSRSSPVYPNSGPPASLALITLLWRPIKILVWQKLALKQGEHKVAGSLPYHSSISAASGSGALAKEHRCCRAAGRYRG